MKKFEVKYTETIALWKKVIVIAGTQREARQKVDEGDFGDEYSEIENDESLHLEILSVKEMGMKKSKGVNRL